jgi:predicted nucleic acid-binding protein
MIILDTDVLINILDKKTPLSKKILDKIREYSDEEIVTTSLNLEEFLYGSLNRDIIIETNHALLQLEILPFTKENAVISANLEVKLEKMGSKKTRGDVMIASIAIQQNAFLFTLNLKHFQVIPGLKLLNI